MHSPLLLRNGQEGVADCDERVTVIYKAAGGGGEGQTREAAPGADARVAAFFQRMI